MVSTGYVSDVARHPAVPPKRNVFKTSTSKNPPLAYFLAEFTGVVVVVLAEAMSIYWKINSLKDKGKNKLFVKNSIKYNWKLGVISWEGRI